MESAFERLKKEIVREMRDTTVSDWVSRGNNYTALLLDTSAVLTLANILIITNTMYASQTSMLICTTLALCAGIVSILHYGPGHILSDPVFTFLDTVAKEAKHPIITEARR